MTLISFLLGALARLVLMKHAALSLPFFTRISMPITRDGVHQYVQKPYASKINQLKIL